MTQEKYTSVYVTDDADREIACVTFLRGRLKSVYVAEPSAVDEDVLRSLAEHVMSIARGGDDERVVEPTDLDRARAVKALRRAGIEVRR